MAITLKISNKTGYTILFSLLIMLFVAGVYAFGTSNPKTFGHSGGELEVDINGTAKTLQKAIDDGDLGGGLDLQNCQWQNWSAWATPPNWGTSTCPAGQLAMGWECEWSSNQQQHPQIQKLPNQIQCRYASSGTRAKSRAYCCNVQ